MAAKFFLVILINPTFSQYNFYIIFCQQSINHYPYLNKRIRNTVQTGGLPTNLSILGELRLNSIDNICADISSLTGGFVWAIGKGLLGDLGDMDFSAIKNKSRSQGDLNMIMNVLTLVGNDNNSEIVSKIAYGLGTSDGISCPKNCPRLGR